MEEAHVMTRNKRTLAAMNADEAAAHVMDNDISELLDQAEVVRERRPAKMVTAVRIDLDTQAALESAAAARGIGEAGMIRSSLWIGGGDVLRLLGFRLRVLLVG